MKFKAYILLGTALLVLAAALVLILTNLGNSWTLHVYYYDAVLPRGMVLLLAALSGIAIYLICRACIPSGIRAWRFTRESQRQKQMQQRLRTLEESRPTQS